MARLVWDAVGERFYETGVSNGVLFKQDKTGKYIKGVAWNGLTGATTSPEGAEPTDTYADNLQYLSVLSAEKLNGTIEALTYPQEFEECDGSKELSPGVTIGQQNRVPFGFVYETVKGNDIEKNDFARKIHVIYGCQAQPSERAYATINDSPETVTFSWGFSTTPVAVEGYAATAEMIFDTSLMTEEQVKKLRDQLYGTEVKEPTLLPPLELLTAIGVTLTPGK